MSIGDYKKGALRRIWCSKERGDGEKEATDSGTMEDVHELILRSKCN